MTVPVIGIDPGGKTTGIVLRQGATLCRAELVECDDDFDHYLAFVCEAVGGFRLAAAGLRAGEALIGVEDLTHPNPHLGLANVMGLLGTAQVIGALRCDFDVIMVPPAKHGASPLAAYPAPLVGAREHGRFGSGRLRHARSAWDIAGATKSAALRARQTA